MPLIRRLRASTALVAVLGLLQAQTAMAQTAPAAAPTLNAMPESSAIVATLASDPARQRVLTPDQKHALLKQDIKYVFVLFQENRSFDQLFGTLPPTRRCSTPWRRAATSL